MCRSTLAVLLVLFLLGCNLRPDRKKEAAAGQPAAEPAAEQTKPGSSTSTPNVSGQQAQDNQAALVEVLQLSSGAKLRLPKNAKAARAPAALPAGIKKVHAFRLGLERQTLLVNELEHGKKDCKALMAEQRDKLQAAQKDTNEARLNFRKMAKVQELKAGAYSMIYAESFQRGLPPKGADPRPMVAMASALMCTPQDFVVVMYASKQSKLQLNIKAMLQKILASYRKGA